MIKRLCARRGFTHYVLRQQDGETLSAICQQLTAVFLAKVQRAQRWDQASGDSGEMGF